MNGNKMMRLPLCLLALMLMLTMTLTPAPARAQPIAIDKVLVVVNEEAITLSEYQARHRREVLQKSGEIAPFEGVIDRRILNRMIDDRIQAQIALRRGINLPPQAVERAITAMARQNGLSVQQLLARLQRDGIAPDQFRASIREQRLIRRLVDLLVNARVSVSEQEVENFLASHQELQASDEAYEISHLVISLAGKSEAEAQSELENLAHIRQGLREGRSFADSVRAFSDSPERQDGGYLGWRKIHQLPQLFVSALRQTEAGGVSEIIRSSNGLHLLKLHDHRRGGELVEQQRIRHILIRPGAELNEADAQELATQLQTRIAAGEDFSKLARAHSADQATGIAGGHLGWINPGDFPPPFERAVGALEVNEVSAPLRTQSGYHLVEVLERRRADISRELAAQRARQVIFRRKAAEFYDNWYGTIRDTAFIEYIAVDPDSDPDPDSG